jgi:predicted alpha/beta superfamily hydrolase
MSTTDDATKTPDWLSLVKSQQPLRSLFTVEPARKMRAPGYEWEHEIRVALPFSYAHTDKLYPTLWITDNSLEAALPVLEGFDMILVAVGAETHVSPPEFQRRRTFDFSPHEDYGFDGPAGDYLRANSPAGWQENKGGGAGRFLDFLVDDVRSALAAEYRMDPNDHGIVGESGGGTFVGFALFARPGAFLRFICGSPALYNSNSVIFDLEERYAAEHDDLPAHVFFAAGEAEITQAFINACGCVSSMVKMAETLSFRGYPSLDLKVRIFRDETHGLLQPLLRWGMPAVWGDDPPWVGWKLG